MTRKEFLASLRSVCLGAFYDKENNECILYVDFNDEKQFMEVLNTADNFSLNGNTMTLNKARMAPLAVFKAEE